MTQIESVLTSLEANAGEFKRLCEAKVCSADLLTDINKALDQGARLSSHIDKIMTHLFVIKDRLE